MHANSKAYNYLLFSCEYAFVYRAITMHDTVSDAILHFQLKLLIVTFSVIRGFAVFKLFLGCLSYDTLYCIDIFFQDLSRH